MNGCIYRTKDNECDLWTDGKHHSWCDPDCTDRHPSNADRIRAMSDEELAGYLNVLKCPPGRMALGHNCKGDGFCRNCWLKWLRQEAKHETV